MLVDLGKNIYTESRIEHKKKDHPELFGMGARIEIKDLDEDFVGPLKKSQFGAYRGNFLPLMDLQKGDLVSYKERTWVATMDFVAANPPCITDNRFQLESELVDAE